MIRSGAAPLSTCEQVLVDGFELDELFADEHKLARFRRVEEDFLPRGHAVPRHAPPVRTLQPLVVRDARREIIQAERQEFAAGKGGAVQAGRVQR